MNRMKLNSEDKKRVNDDAEGHELFKVTVMIFVFIQYSRIN